MTRSYLGPTERNSKSGLNPLCRLVSALTQKTQLYQGSNSELSQCKRTTNVETVQSTPAVRNKDLLSRRFYGQSSWRHPWLKHWHQFGLLEARWTYIGLIEYTRVYHSANGGADVIWSSCPLSDLDMLRNVLNPPFISALIQLQWRVKTRSLLSGTGSQTP